MMIFVYGEREREKKGVLKYLIKIFDRSTMKNRKESAFNERARND
jgi:hypothetical protein